VAAYAQVEGPQIVMTGLVASLDGRRVIRLQEAGEDPNELGLRLARQALAQGAAEILAFEA
jgi:hydroxymethylbilane synthase